MTQEACVWFNPAMASLGRLKALVVEDDAQVARAVARCLRLRTAEATIAGTFHGALSAVGPFDVGVFDIELPDGDGIEAARELLARRTVHLAVFFSGQEDPALVRRARELGPYVHKGDGAEALVQAIGTAMVSEIRQAVAVGEPETPTPRRSGRATSGIRRRFPR